MSGHRIRKLAIGAAAVALIATVAQSAMASPARPAGHHDGGRPLQHIFYIMMENHGYSEIIGNWADAPFTNLLARHSGLETDYYGVTHPSLPNYLAAISGDFQGIWDYLTPQQIASASATAHMFSGHNLVDQLEAHHLSWRAYMQSMPSVGSQVEYGPTIDTPNGPVTIKLYAQKHNPFMYFSDINYPGSPRLKNIVPFEGRFAADLASGRVPSFVWISPDQCHDMHGIAPDQAALIGIPSCGYPDSGLDHGAIQLGDAFLRSTITQIESSRVWRTTNSAIVVTWDEDDYTGFSGCCGSPTGNKGVILGGAQVPTIVVTHGGFWGSTLNVPSNHYSLLATIEQLWHLGCLANSCDIPPSGLLTPLFRSWLLQTSHRTRRRRDSRRRLFATLRLRDEDVLHFRVQVGSVHPHLAADAALLVAAEGCLGVHAVR